MKITLDQANRLKNSFLRLASTEDFLTLINLASKYLFGNFSNPFTEVQLKQYADSELNSQYYTVFSVKKKSGKNRVIMAPEPGLKTVLQCINLILQSTYVPHEAATGFTINKSIITNAQLHVKKKYVFNIDLKDFFHSFSGEKLKSCLSNLPFSFDGDKDFMSSIISEICISSINTKNGAVMVLPQGSPASPMLTNILCLNLDISLFKLAEQYSMIYSRYADDITFSSDNNIFTDETFLVKLKQIIEEYGLKINTKKTRLQFKSSRQQATGLVINEKVNVSRNYIKEIRMWLYYWDKYGYPKAQKLFTNDYNTRKKYSKNKKPELVNVLEGKLNFLKMVKGQNDTTFLGLKQKFSKLSFSTRVKLLANLKSKLNIGLFFIEPNGRRFRQAHPGVDSADYDVELEAYEDSQNTWRIAQNQLIQNGPESLTPTKVANDAPWVEGTVGTVFSYGVENHHLLLVNEDNHLTGQDFAMSYTIDTEQGKAALAEVRNPNAFKVSKPIMDLIKKEMENAGLTEEQREALFPANDKFSSSEKDLGIRGLARVADVLLNTNMLDGATLQAIRGKVISTIFNVPLNAEVHYVNSFFVQALTYDKAYSKYETQLNKWLENNKDKTVEQSPISILTDNFSLETVVFKIEQTNNPVNISQNPYPFVEDPTRDTIFNNLVFHNNTWYEMQEDGSFEDVAVPREIIDAVFKEEAENEEGVRKKETLVSDNFVLSEIRNYNGTVSYKKSYINIDQDSIDGTTIFNFFRENLGKNKGLKAKEAIELLYRQFTLNFEGENKGKPSIKFGVNNDKLVSFTVTRQDSDKSFTVKITKDGVITVEDEVQNPVLNYKIAERKVFNPQVMTFQNFTFGTFTTQLLPIDNNSSPKEEEVFVENPIIKDDGVVVENPRSLNGVIAKLESTGGDPTLIKTLKALKEDQRLVSPEKSENNKYIVNGEEFDRVTSVLRNDFDGDPNDHYRCRNKGTVIDEIVRAFFLGQRDLSVLSNIVKVDVRYKNEGEKNKDGSVIKIVRTETKTVGDYIGEATFNKLQEALHKLEKDFNSQGLHVISEKINLFNLESKIAGEIDLLLYDDKGNVYIYDTKTSCKNFEKALDDRYADKLTKRESYTERLSMYRILFDLRYNQKPIDSKLLSIRVKASETGSIQDIQVPKNRDTGKKKLSLYTLEFDGTVRRFLNGSLLKQEAAVENLLKNEDLPTKDLILKDVNLLTKGVYSVNVTLMEKYVKDTFDQDPPNYIGKEGTLNWEGYKDVQDLLDELIKYGAVVEKGKKFPNE